MSRVAACVGSLLVAAASLGAQTPRDPPPDGLLAMREVESEGAIPATLTVTSSSAIATGPLPLVHSDYGEKVSPGLQWTGVPATARSIAVIMEDPDAREPKPFVHWMLYNLPAEATSLPEALPGLPRLPELHGALQGRNSRGTIGYFGPRPHKTDRAHRYHFQVFAVTETLSLLPSASREALLGALRGRVIAAGEMVVTFQAPLDAR